MVNGRRRGFIYWLKWKDEQGWHQQSVQKFFGLSAPVCDVDVARTLVADHLLKELKGQLGVPIEPASPGVKEFYMEYMRNCDRTKTANTARADSYRFKRWLAFLDKKGVEKLSGVSRQLLTEFISDELKDLKNSTVNTYITIIRASLAWAVDRGHLKENPLKGYRQLKAMPYVRPARWSREDLRKLVSIQDKLFLAYLKLVYYTLMRRSEALHLRWSDIDLVSETITVMRTKSGKPRLVPIVPKLKKLLKALPRSGERLFPWSDHHTTQKFRKLKKRLPLKSIQGIHHFRHLRASELIRKGANPKGIQQALGHSTLHTTLRIYTLEDIAGVRKAMGG